MRPLDRIVLRGLVARGNHGVYEHERRDGQTFRIDVVAHLDLSRAGRSDDLAETVDYGVLAADVVAAVERDPVDLIEVVAERVAAIVLANAAVRAVDVTVHKPEAPLTVAFSDVEVVIHRTWTPVVVALGANLGDREATLRDAVAELAAHRLVRLLAASPIVETPALKPDGVDDSAPAYLNAVVELSTALPPQALLAELQRIEAAHGRTREVRWGDRTLDLDLIAYGDERFEEPGLTVPHPRAAERAFVLAPWAAMNEDAVLPGRGRVIDLLDEVLAATAERVEPFPARPLA